MAMAAWSWSPVELLFAVVQVGDESQTAFLDWASRELLPRF